MLFLGSGFRNSIRGRCPSRMEAAHNDADRRPIISILLMENDLSLRRFLSKALGETGSMETHCEAARRPACLPGCSRAIVSLANRPCKR